MSIRTHVTITHNGPEDIQIELSRTFFEKDNRRYYIYKNFAPPNTLCPEWKYLHSDGIFRSSAIHNGNLSGWYASLNEVEAAMNKYIALQEQHSLSEVMATEPDSIAGNQDNLIT